MIFNSVTYLVFLAIVVPIAWIVPRRARLWLFFVSSLVFYGFWRFEYLAIMLISATVDYFAAHGIYSATTRWRRRAFLGLSLGVNLGFLFYFKYLIFFANNTRSLLHFLGIGVQIPLWDILLPLGISFYTFETISYTIDVYRGFIPPERSYLLYGCFITYFPHLIAGPILRAGEVMPQLNRQPGFNLQDFGTGLRRMLGGIFLKVVLADQIAPLVDAGFAEPVAQMSAFDIWTLAFLFGFQIYLDFSAYSHIALGCSRMMGIRFPENFAFPYLATSPRDFWRRWHISLSSWIRDYLYLPLAGSRVDDRSVGGLGVAVDGAPSRRRTRALFLTWAIMGFWHGANWTFVAWGLYHATLIFLYRLTSSTTARLPRVLQDLGGWGVTLPLIMLGWIPFRSQSLSDAFARWAKVIDPRQYRSLGLRESTYVIAAVLLLMIIIAFGFNRWVRPPLEQHRFAWSLVETVGLTVAISLAFIFLRPISQFIYFQF
jgi:D-alanyl-lipoteichoic acid acyltransferase DltB (MBOAT superfamily)